MSVYIFVIASVSEAIHTFLNRSGVQARYAVAYNNGSVNV